MPAVSIIIPLYNAEKYIGECLESILAQTFRDFEVIVVDDCSTDNSVAVVESYFEKFGGRLKLAHTEKNSGGAGVPRNIGLEISSGEYVFFVDADDFIVETALDILHTAAAQYDTDVIYNPVYYLYESRENIKIASDRDSTLAGENDRMILTINDPNKNLHQLIFGGDFRGILTKFIRRDFLIENEITFPPNLPLGEDFIWVLLLYCHSKRFLRLPIPLYFCRLEAQSLSHRKRMSTEQISYWISRFAAWLKTLDEVTNKTEFLRENPRYCYAAANVHFNWCFECISQERAQVNNFDLYEILYREFADSTVPFFVSVIDAYKKHSLITQKRIAELEEEINRLKGKE